MQCYHVSELSLRCTRQGCFHLKQRILCLFRLFVINIIFKVFLITLLYHSIINDNMFISSIYFSLDVGDSSISIVTYKIESCKNLH